MKNIIGAFATIIATLTLCKCNTTQRADLHYVEQVGEQLIWHDTHEPALFYGTNYTAPFAYAYRAIERKGIDHKKAIEQDVYHMARLGFNAFRLHIWDVEITDSVGNLIENEHLDLLDYLISKVEERGMYVILTLQTNFGNGYPEKDIPTSGYTYKYEKCNVHSNPEAQEAQKRYVTALMKHVNKYTGRCYGNDYMTVGYEINNEPCHVGDPNTTNEYVRMMTHTLRNAGCTRLIFYNASHNFPEHTAAYFDSTNINGVTFQWYPMALVHNRARKGNFLPSVDTYAIPFDTLKNFNNVARIVYEFDPADNDYTHLYPAMTRSFRNAGMTWATQFAYDPTSIADCNTEYVTHYMNLAYTPGKAISQMIAAEVMLQNDITDYTKPYPTDTIFGYCTLSYHADLALWNDGQKYYNTNTTNIAPTNANTLEHIAGVGCSPLVEYDGTGAYFIDKISDGIWRLEIMPDVIRLRDAYQYTNGKQLVATTQWNTHTMKLNISNIGNEYTITNKNNKQILADSIQPGVYIVATTNKNIDVNKFNDTKVNNNIGMWEFVAPEPSVTDTCKQTEDDMCDIEFFSIPEWHGISYLIDGNNICANYSPDNNPYNYIIRKRINKPVNNFTKIKLNISNINGLDSITISAINSDGIAFSKQIAANKGINAVDVRELEQATTPILPRGWPIFVNLYINTNIKLCIKDIEFIDISTGNIKSKANITFSQFDIE